MNANQTVVWLDQQEARVLGVDLEKVEEVIVTAPEHHFHRHPKGPSPDREHPSDAAHFFKDVATALRGSAEVLVVGPSTAKLHFLRYLAGHDASLEARVVGIETVDHPTDGQLVAYARRYFATPKALRQ